MQVKVRALNPYQSKLIIYLSINLNSVINKEVVKVFMVELNDMIYRK